MERLRVLNSTRNPRAGTCAICRCPGEPRFLTRLGTFGAATASAAELDLDIRRLAAAGRVQILRAGRDDDERVHFRAAAGLQSPALLSGGSILIVSSGWIAKLVNRFQG